MKNKLSKLDIIECKTPYNNKVADNIWRYIEYKYPEYKDFYIDSWNIVEDALEIFVITENNCDELIVDIDVFLEWYNKNNI